MENPDSGLAVKFFVQAVENPKKTREAGRPIYEDKEYISIRFPADNKRTLEAPAHEIHYDANTRQHWTYAERFAAIYREFKDHSRVLLSGTPVDEAPFLTAAKRSELKALNIHTLEQLVAMPDRGLNRLGMDGTDLVDQAKSFLDVAKGSAEVNELRAMVEKLQAQIAQGKEPEAPKPDGLDEYEDEDLRNMLENAGKTVRANASRKSMLADLRAMVADNANMKATEEAA